MVCDDANVVSVEGFTELGVICAHCGLVHWFTGDKIGLPVTNPEGHRLYLRHDVYTWFDPTETGEEEDGFVQGAGCEDLGDTEPATPADHGRDCDCIQCLEEHRETLI